MQLTLQNSVLSKDRSGNVTYRKINQEPRVRSRAPDPSVPGSLIFYGYLYQLASGKFHFSRRPLMSPASLPARFLFYLLLLVLHSAEDVDVRLEEIPRGWPR